MICCVNNTARVAGIMTYFRSIIDTIGGTLILHLWASFSILLVPHLKQCLPERFT